MQTAPIIVDLSFARCGECKVLLKDELATRCPTCGAVFDRITSNHVGLARKFTKKRDEAGVRFEVLPPGGRQPAAAETPAAAPKSAGNGEGAAHQPEVLTASIIVDIAFMRCGHCKVMFTDELAEHCPTCGALFDRVSSNHVGLARKLEKLRAGAKSGNAAAAPVGH